MPLDERFLALDLGGVLLEDGTKTGFQRLELLGVDPAEAERVWHSDLRLGAELGKITSDEVFEQLAKITPGVKSEAVEELVLAEFRPISYGVDSLIAAKAQGYTVILATNHLNEWLDRWRTTFDWFELIDYTVCSAAVADRKPNASYYRRLTRIARRTGFAFVDDDPGNVRAASSAGLHGVLASEEWARLVGIHG